MFYVGQPIRTRFRGGNITAHIVRKSSIDHFVLKWELGKKSNAEKFNRLFSAKQLSNILSGKEELKEEKYE